MGRFVRRRPVLVVLVALPVVLVAAAMALLPRDRLAGQVAAAVTDATGAELDPGSIGLTVSRGLGLQFSGGRLRGQGDELFRRTGIGQGVGVYEVAYSQLKLSLSPTALFRRRVVIRNLELAGPKLMVATGNGPLRLTDYVIRVRNLQLGPASGPTPSGSAPGDRLPADLKFSLQADVGELVLGGAPWRSVRLAGNWEARRLAVTELAAELGAGTLAAMGAVDYAADPWGVADWNVRLADVPAGPLLGPYLPELAARLTCDLSGEVTGSVGLGHTATQLDSLVVTGDLTGGEGVLRAADWLQEAEPYLGERRDLTTIRFERLSHTFRVAEGRYLIETLALDGPDTDWQARGWLEFGGNIRVRVGVLLPTGFTPDLGGMSFLAETLRDDQGRVQLGLKLTGLTAAPTLGLDLNEMFGRR